MANNKSLHSAKDAKDDEFYTQYQDIEREMNAYVEYNSDVFRDKVILLPCDDPEWSEFTRYFAANFERLGIKKLISTSYSKSSGSRQLTWLEESSPLYDPQKHKTRGKLFVLERDTNGDGRIDPDDIELSGYLNGDGDFRSEEVTALRDEADIIITNPPFSLIREFLNWILEGQKQFAIIGNQNIPTYKGLFELVIDRAMWLGSFAGDMSFKVPEDSPPRETRFWIDETGQKWRSMGNIAWITNLDHSKRHTPLSLDSMENNLRFNKTLRRELLKRYGNDREYPRYDNYDALEVPSYQAIPSDYSGVMGVPVTAFDKLSPDQFVMLGVTLGTTTDYPMSVIYENAIQHNQNGTTQGGNKVNTRAAIRVHQRPSDRIYYTADNAEGYLLSLYPRVLIRNKLL